MPKSISSVCVCVCVQWLPETQQFELACSLQTQLQNTKMAVWSSKNSPSEVRSFQFLFSFALWTLSTQFSIVRAQQSQVYSDEATIMNTSTA